MLPTIEALESSKLQLLLSVVQDLSLARTMDQVTTIVRQAARELTGADGATFVLRDNDLCYYADELAIAPLWKGKRFPMKACISGWVMMKREPAVIKDIFEDPRIPIEAYRPTFVKSLAMVPIRRKSPIGAIGNYWATQHQATEQQLQLLQALADSTSIALENIQLYNELEKKVKERTADLEAFSYSASHDLRAPIARISGFAELLQEDHGVRLDPEGLQCVDKIRSSAEEMIQRIDSLLSLSRVNRTNMKVETVDLSALTRKILDALHADDGRDVETHVHENMRATGDPGMLHAALENLIRNAWKFSRHSARARIEVGSRPDQDGKPIYFVKDNGAGFDHRQADKLFTPFQRLHSEAEFTGTGIGLATVQRIILRHEGKIWAESEPNRGATFHFTLSLPHPA